MKRIIYPFIFTLFLVVSSLLLSGCSGIGGVTDSNLDKKLSKLADFDKDGYISDYEMPYYNSYKLYFKINPQELEEFYAERMLQKNEATHP